MLEVDRREFVPMVTPETRKHYLNLPPAAYLGENPVSSTLIIPGTAGSMGERLAGLKHPQDPRALRCAKALHDAWLAYYRGDTDRSQEIAVRLFDDINANGQMRPVSVEVGETRHRFSSWPHRISSAVLRAMGCGVFTLMRLLRI